MKKSVLTTAAALYSLTALTAPAHASDFGRMGIGLGIAILGKVIEGAGGSHSSERRHSDRSERADRSTSSGKRNSEAVASRDPSITLPDVGPTIEPRPDPASVIVAQTTDDTTTAAVSTGDAAQQVQPVAAVWPNGLLPALADAKPSLDAVTPTAGSVTLAAVTSVTPSNAPAPTVAVPASTTGEVANIEAIDENLKSWGFHTKSETERANKLGALGMSLSQAYEAAGFTRAAVVALADTSVTLVDERGRTWGKVPAKTADYINKGIAMGMVPSKAFAFIGKLKDPDQQTQEAAAKVVAVSQPTSEDVLGVCTNERAIDQILRIRDVEGAKLKSEMPPPSTSDDPSGRPVLPPSLQLLKFAFGPQHINGTTFNPSPECASLREQAGAGAEKIIAERTTLDLTQELSVFKRLPYDAARFSKQGCAEIYQDFTVGVSVGIRLLTPPAVAECIGMGITMDAEATYKALHPETMPYEKFLYADLNCAIELPRFHTSGAGIIDKRCLMMESWQKQQAHDKALANEKVVDDAVAADHFGSPQKSAENVAVSPQTHAENAAVAPASVIVPPAPTVAAPAVDKDTTAAIAPDAPKAAPVAPVAPPAPPKPKVDVDL